MTVSSLCNDMSILAAFMLVGFFIRGAFKPVQKLFLSSSLIDGLLLLFLGHQAVGIITMPESSYGLPGMLIDIVMTSLVFGANFNWERISSYLDYSCVTMTSYGMQMRLGVGLGWVLSKMWTGLPWGWGAMGVFSFHGGHGTAAAAVSVFQKLGVDGSMAVGMVLSTFGLAFAMVVGMAMVNYRIREGWDTYVKEPKKQPSYFHGRTLSREKRAASGHTITTAVSIDHLVLQTSWLSTVLFLGRTTLRFLGIRIPLFTKLPGVSYGVFGGAILWKILKMTKLDRYVGVKTVKMFGGFFLEIMVFTIMATLNLEFVSTYIAPTLIYAVVIYGLTIPLILYLSYRFCKDEWFEEACMTLGAATGNTSAGPALVRAIDPDSQSRVEDTHGVYSTIMSWKDTYVGLTLMWLMSGIALTFGASFAMMIGFAVTGFVFSNRRERR